VPLEPEEPPDDPEDELDELDVPPVLEELEPPLLPLLLDDEGDCGTVVPLHAAARMSIEQSERRRAFIGQ
jgi:hypothetical protein